MNISIQSFNVRLAAAALACCLWTHTSQAGYSTTVTTGGSGTVGASLAFGTTNAVLTPSTSLPSAGVATSGTFTSFTNPPLGSPLVCTSTVRTVFLVGGYKAQSRAYVTTGVTADNPALKKKLADEGFSLVPSLCGASYDITSGDEVIDGKRYLVVLGNATAASAAWFRGYVFAGTPTNRDDVIANGTKLYEAIVKGPFDFGDPNSPDRCKAMKIPIEYAGTNLVLVSDGLAESATDLQFVNVPLSITIGCSDPLVYPALQTSGGCGSVNVTYTPAANLLPPGGGMVTATATDSANNTTTIQFAVIRPFIQFTGFYSPISGSGGSCTAPIRAINAGSKIPIKFDSSFCGVPYQSATPPNVTITKINPLTCAPIAVPINHLQFQWVANQWHFNWDTLSTDKGRYRIEVVLGDGSPNPYAIVDLR